MLYYGIYTRKSDDDRSITEKSIGEQLAECTSIVERDSLSVLQTWEESRSARHPNRRVGYSELIKLIRHGRIQGIVCWHVNRLVRNMEEGGVLAQMLIDGMLKEVRTPSAIYRTGDNIMPLVIEAASATQYSLDHAKAVKRGMDGSFRAGGCTNKAPQGYRNVRDPLNLKKGLVERDPDRFDLVRKGWDLILTGSYSVKQVITTLNQTWGFRTRPTRKGGNKPLSYSAAYGIFSNPFYAGFVHRKGELVKGTHEAMVTVDEFARVQSIMHHASFEAPRVKEYPYTGLMRCAYCGQQITGEVKRLRDGRLWENYHCSDANLTCTKQGMSRSKVEALILQQLTSIEIEPILLQEAGENIRRAIANTSSNTLAVVESQEAELRECNKRLQRLSDMWLDGVLNDAARYRELEERELAQKNRITMEIERMRNAVQTTEQNLSRSLKFLGNVTHKLLTSSDKAKKEICRAVATSYIFDGRRKTIVIDIHPLLKELVSYVQRFGRLEPQETGSDKQRKLPPSEAVFFGGEMSCGLEVPASMQQQLSGALFPDLWPDEACDPSLSEKKLRPLGSEHTQGLNGVQSRHRDWAGRGV